MANERKAARRLKRGGGAAPLSLDFEGAEAGAGAVTGPPRRSDPEEYFHREWVRSLFGLGGGDPAPALRGLGQRLHFPLFERYDLEGRTPERPTYAELAAEHGLTPVTR